MKTELTQAQIDDYQRDGCLILEDFLNEDELAELVQAVELSVARMGKSKVAGEGNRALVEGDDYYDRVFFQRLNLWKINETVRRCFLNPQLGRMLSRLENIDGIRIWHDQTLQKQAWANPTAWHLDNPYWSFHSRHAISIWIALDDATVQNGCLYYLPGSHKISRYDNVDIGHEMGDLFRHYPAFKSIEPMVAEMRAGTAGVHNGLTAHGAGPNMTPYPRRAMTCAYMPDGAVFNGQQNILSRERVAAMNAGDLLDDDEQNPRVWPER